jgi:hypothetical protein
VSELCEQWSSGALWEQCTQQWSRGALWEQRSSRGSSGHRGSSVRSGGGIYVRSLRFIAYLFAFLVRFSAYLCVFSAFLVRFSAYLFAYLGRVKL